MKKNYEMVGNDLLYLQKYQRNPKQLRKVCDAMNECVAFTEFGWLKNKMTPYLSKRYTAQTWLKEGEEMPKSLNYYKQNQ